MSVLFFLNHPLHREAGLRALPPAAAVSSPAAPPHRLPAPAFQVVLRFTRGLIFTQGSNLVLCLKTPAVLLNSFPHLI